MELKDYLHFYEGALCRWRYVDYPPGQWNVLAPLSKRDIARLCDDHSVDKIEIRLRPLSDFGEKEIRAIAKIVGKEDQLSDVKSMNYVITQVKEHGLAAFSVPDGEFKFVPELIRYLLSEHFDIFGLIEAGLAIDSTKQ